MDKSISKILGGLAGLLMGLATGLFIFHFVSRKVHLFLWLFIFGDNATSTIISFVIETFILATTIFWIFCLTKISMAIADSLSKGISV